jgi:hypothetical protein
VNNRTFAVFVSVVAALGFIAGYRLSELPRFDDYKLWNIAGLFYDLLAVIVLSEIATSNAKWKQRSVEVIAPAVLWFQTAFPLGALIGGGVAVLFGHKPSAGYVAKFALLFWSYSIIPVFLLDEFVAFPRLASKKIESRWRWFGLLLLLSGVVLQLIAAIESLSH